MTPRSQLFLEPPRWLRVRHHGNRPIPPHIASWLFESGSLTRRLRQVCGGQFRVRLLRQAWDKPCADESRALRLAMGRRAVVREVALQWGDRPLVLARSVIPAKTLKGVDRRLAHLGTRPLGEILFADPRLHRKHLELTKIGPHHWRPECPGGGAALSRRIWGRRSLYGLGAGHKLLVAEFFLPELFDLDNSP
ncbi:chorismate--pyruvate lyase family protein [Methylomagnum sp.]